MKWDPTVSGAPVRTPQRVSSGDCSCFPTLLWVVQMAVRAVELLCPSLCVSHGDSQPTQLTYGPQSSRQLVSVHLPMTLQQASQPGECGAMCTHTGKLARVLRRQDILARVSRFWPEFERVEHQLLSVSAGAENAGLVFSYVFGEGPCLGVKMRRLFQESGLHR